MDYILKRLTERSTWIGLISLLTGVGVAVNPAWVEPIVALGVSLAGFIGIVTPDKNENDAQ